MLFLFAGKRPATTSIVPTTRQVRPLKTVSTTVPTNDSTTASADTAVRTAWYSRRGLWLLTVGALTVPGLLLAVPDWTESSGPRASGPLRIHTVARGELEVAVIEKGTLASSLNTEIKCRIRGGYGGRGGHSVVTWIIPPGSVVNEGDELVRFDTKVIEETISLGKTDTNNAKAELTRAEVQAALAKTSVDAYLNGEFKSRMQELHKQLEVAQYNRDTAQAMLNDTRSLYRRGFVTSLEVEASAYTVEQAQLELDVKKTEIDVLERLTKAMRLETLNGQITATEARLAGRQAGVELEESRLNLAIQEFENCTIRAPRSGLVIYPSAADWKNTPDITVGASVHNNQVLLLMPDLSRMQVKIGIHESIVGQVQPGMPVEVSLATGTLDASVSSVAAVASPAGWWNGNAVRYDTFITLPGDAGLKPGMTADVRVVLKRHEDVLTVPIDAVVHTPDGYFCWVSTANTTERRRVKPGDASDQFIVIKEGLSEGDAVVVDPVSSVTDARELVAPTLVHTVSSGSLLETLTEQGTLESSNNTEIKCRVRGSSTVNWVIESGTEVQAGDELVRLENKQIEEHLHERTKYAHLSEDAAIGFRTQATVAGIAVKEYLEGRYRTELMRLEKDLAIAKQNLSTADSMLRHGKAMFDRGYESQLDIDEKETALRQARLDVKIKETEIEVLKNFTKKEEVETLTGNWKAALAAANGHEEVLKNDLARIAQAREELTRCVITAPRDGLVIYPRGREWRDEPEIAEGSTVHNDRVLLLMPDLSQMQVRVGIHETMLDEIRPGMPAAITLPDRTLEGEVVSVASVADPPGWWSGNVVVYDAIISLPGAEGLKPGMTAEVEIRMARHENMLLIPLAAVVESADGAYCWVGTPEQAERRRVELGPGNDRMIAVEKGLRAGEQVVINPGSYFSVADPSE